MEPNILKSLLWETQKWYSPFFGKFLLILSIGKHDVQLTVLE